MRQAVTELTVQTRGTGFVEITRDVQEWVGAEAAGDGLATLFIRHTSASLVVQENADPDVLTDLTAFFERVAPRDPSLYVHGAEGPDDMPAHIRTLLTGTHLAVPVRAGRLMLGTWQGIYVAEHRARPHTRRIAVHLLTE